MNKNIIIAILLIVIIGAGAFIFTQLGGKTNSEIKFIDQGTIQNGEQIQLELKDAQGNPIAGQNVTITFDGEKYSAITDSAGKAYLTIYGENPGSYEVSAEFGGNDRYAATSAKTTITITDGAADNPASQTDSSATATSKNTDSSSSSSSESSGGSSGGSSSQDKIYEDRVHGITYNENNIILSSPDGGGVGMTLDEYLAWRPDPFR